MRLTTISAISLGLIGLLAGCSSKPRDIDPSKEKLIDKLTLFVEAVQADKFEQAFSYLTSDERSKMMEPGGVVSDRVRRQLQALRLSTLAQKPTVRLVQGKLDGISEALPMVAEPSGAPPARNVDMPLLQ